MDDRKHNSIEPWGDWEYGTGRTKPPKSHSGMIAVLLILVILLCSVVSVLGVLNIRLFQKLSQREEEASAIAFAEETVETTAAPTETTPDPARSDVTMDLHTAPQAIDNVPQTGGLSLQEIYEKNIPSVVSVSCALSSGSASGTGVILSSQGYIVTNAHVIDGAQAIRVLLTDGRELDACLVGTDAVSDLAVLRIQADGLISAQFGDSDTLRVGDSVAAIGDPLGVDLRGTMTDGIISAINRDVSINGRTMNLIQTNAALNSGNSGGPLINCYGLVVGINTMKISAFTDQAGVEGLGFAIPSTTVKEVVEQIMDYGYVPGRPTLGITCEALSRFYQHFYRLPAGLYINQVDVGGAAWNAGLQAGDILVSLDGEALSATDDLNRILGSHAVGDEVTLYIYRAGFGEGTVTVALTEARG
ncbi:MAG: S1C family serine protease [Faecousia sp.]